jgi:hypothetical protein
MHVANGDLTQYREKAVGHCRVYYLEREVKALAERWKPKRRRRLPSDALTIKYVRRGARDAIAVKAIPMILENRPLAEICLACGTHPWIIQEIYESLKLGLDGAQKRREMIMREKIAMMEAEFNMQTRRGDEFYYRKSRLERSRYEQERRLVRSGGKREAG